MADEVAFSNKSQNLIDFSSIESTISDDLEENFVNSQKNEPLENKLHHDFSLLNECFQIEVFKQNQVSSIKY